MRYLVIGVCVALGACVQPSAVECGFGTCPPDSGCDEVHMRCVLADQLVSCLGKPDDATCQAGMREGVCVDAVCLAKGCGDLRLDGAEECDGTQFIKNATDCIGIGYYEPGPIACKPDCTIDDSSCSRRCGDDVEDPEEVCEWNIAGADTTCDALGFYNTEPAPCSLFCAYDIQKCQGYCGDDTLNGPELCDGSVALPSYLSCLDYGLDSGHLSCSSGCYADTTACHHFGLSSVGAAPTSGSYNSIYMAGPTTAFLVGGDSISGTWARWNGVSITPMTIPMGPAYFAASGTSAINVFAAGNKGRISHFDGTSVTDTTFGANDSFYGLHVRTSTDGYVVGSSTVPIIRHWDGTNWTTMTPNTTAILLGVYALSATDAWAVGTAGVLLHLTGTTWTPTTWPGSVIFRAVWGSSSSDVFAVGDSGTILHFNGATWSAMSSPTTLRLTSVWGNAADDVYAAGTSVMLHYDGQHWVQLETTATAMHVGSSIDATHSVIEQNYGSLLRWDGAGWTVPETLPDYAIAMWGTSETNLYMAASTEVQHYDGTAWTSVPGTTGPNIISIWGADANNIFVGGNQTILRYNGSTWTSATVGTGGVFTAIWAATATDAWAVTEVGDLYHFDGTWTFDSNIDTSASVLWGTSGSDVFLGGGSGISHYNGLSWSTSLVASSVTSIWGPSSSNIYATADTALLHYDGSTWSEVALPNTGVVPLTAVRGTGPDDIFVFGNGAMFHYDGTQWTPVRQSVANQTVASPWITDHDVFGATGSTNQVVLLRRACITCGL